MRKNIAGQKWVVYAYNTSTDLPVTGDAVNITANLRIDGAAANAVDDTNPTELEEGYYVFDISQAETNGNQILIAPSSVTGSVRVVGVPEAVWTTPLNFSGGDFAITLTVRTTGSVPISGIAVWVNSTNDRSETVSGVKYTDTNGQVVFNLEYTTYYVFCRLSGYSFAASQFTASAGNVSFTLDIASTTVTGTASTYGDSFLSRNIVEVRDYLDEPTIKAKYDDNKIISVLEKAYIIVFNEINRNSKTPAVVKLPIDVAQNTLKYVLPHTLGSLYAVYNQDETGGKVFYDSRGRYNSAGRGMWMEGQTLNLQTTEMYGIGLTLIAEYIPNGVARLHNGVCTISADGLTVTFGATPNAGVLDTHREAYAGGVFRHLLTEGTTVTGNFMQERNILRYDETAREAILDVALDPIPTTDDGLIYYEIAPSIYKGMDTVVSLYAAYKICLTEGNRKRADGILTAYRNEIRNVRLTAYYTNMKDAPKLRSDSHENRRFSRSWRI
ncbi:hypothetical protein LCGC14_0588700 [marine sediment metagenome]|uniref:Uncharacterized protein n=1 Tax=marine sediment metagenome TaxID=412755 RepID=A0A0F9U0G2_9ZZZZ